MQNHILEKKLHVKCHHSIHTRLADVKDWFWLQPLNETVQQIMFLRLNLYNQVPLFRDSPSFKGVYLRNSSLLIQFFLQICSRFCSSSHLSGAVRVHVWEGLMKDLYTTASLFALQAKVEGVRANRRRIAPVNSTVTFSCDEKIHVYS